jgi:hypothetical protein
MQDHIAVQCPCLLQIFKHRLHVVRIPLHDAFAVFNAAKPVAQPGALGQHLRAQVAVQVPVEDLRVGALVRGHGLGILTVGQIAHPVLLLVPPQRVALRQFQATAPAALDEVLHRLMAAAPARVQEVQGVFQRGQIVRALLQHQAHPVRQWCVEIVLAALAQQRGSVSGSVCNGVPKRDSSCNAFGQA